MERRRENRLRTRLRAGKLYGPKGRFLSDCTVLDRSQGGARLLPFDMEVLREEMLFLDESDGLRWPVRLAWQGEQTAGVTFAGEAERPSRLRMSQIAGPYYAVV